MAPSLTSRLFVGRVMHARHRPRRHRFSYRVFWLLVDLDELPQLERRCRLLSINRPGLFSFHERDHGPRDGSALRPWIDAQLARFGLAEEVAKVELLSFPRVLGYVFNPLSLWFCRRADGGLAAVLYEVSNTFGERHGYLIPVAREAARAEVLDQACDKGFYVSPFIGMAARYRFRLRPPGDRLALAIRQSVPEGRVLDATMTAQARPLSDGRLLRLGLTHPLLTQKIMAAIHWEALRIWLKGASYHRRPPAPGEAVSLAPARGGPEHGLQ